MNYTVTTEPVDDGVRITIERDSLTYSVTVAQSYLDVVGGADAYCTRTGYADAELFWNPPIVDPPQE